LDLHCEPDNFIDAYLINALKNDPNVVFTDEFRLTLALDSGDLWAGGLETVVITLTWAIVFMIHHPEIQQKCILWNTLYLY
jgi:cytochrome P450